jgi:hypothetical protein
MSSNSEECILVSLAHQSQTIKSVYPAFRILGFYDNMDAAVRFAKKNEDSLREFSVFIYLLAQPFPICVSIKNQSDPNYIALKVESVMRAHSAKIEQCNKEFEDDVSKKQIGPVLQSDYAKRLKWIRENKEDIEKTKKQFLEVNANLPDCPMIQEKRLSRPGKPFAGISVIADREPNGEIRVGHYRMPLIVVWKDFSSEKEAEEFGKNPAHTELSKYPYYTVAWKSDLCHDWLFPDDIDLEAMHEIYRNTKLNEYMNYRKQEKRNIKEYEEFCKKNQVKALEQTLGDDPVPAVPQISADSPQETAEQKRSVKFNITTDENGLQSIESIKDEGKRSEVDSKEEPKEDPKKEPKIDNFSGMYSSPDQKSPYG